MRKIRVLHLTSTRYGIGGVEKLLLDMSNKYDTARFSVSYCNLFCDAGGSGAFPTALRKRGLEVFEIRGQNWREMPRMVVNLARLLRREQFDILHLHMLQATIIGGLAARLARRIKVVVTKHYSDDLSKQHAVVKAFDNYFTKTADCVSAISNYVKGDMIRLSVPESKITVIYNGTDVAEFDSRAQSSLAFGITPGSTAFLIGTVGSLTERKGHRHLFEAIQAILKERSDVRFVVIGEGPEKENLERLRISLGIADSITMLGFQANVAPIVKQLDLYVHPSVQEPFGIAVLEAMAAGKCVVATAVGGVPEIVVPCETGYLVEPNDPPALSAAISDALANHEKTQLMGANGRARVTELFDINTTVKEYESLYAGLF